MERKKLNSGNIRAVGYDPGSQTLEIEFAGGSIVQYTRVSPEVYRRFAGSSAPMSFFRDNIEEAYSARRVR